MPRPYRIQMSVSTVNYIKYIKIHIIPQKCIVEEQAKSYGVDPDGSPDCVRSSGVHPDHSRGCQKKSHQH